MQVNSRQCRIDRELGGHQFRGRGFRAGRVASVDQIDGMSGHKGRRQVAGAQVSETEACRLIGQHRLALQDTVACIPERVNDFGTVAFAL